ncbi:MAG: hypothetical protein JSU94_10900 [Phycisphaerales bacterium]|nr:MAG: hypothetical protein JSU94_10900 [Phycisphaerales bacterium]
MDEKPIIVLGAGATKACGGPLTDEILPAALNGEMAHDDRTTLVEDREELLALASDFLQDCFNVPLGREKATKKNCPSLPMVLSMLRRSAAAGMPIGAWQGDRLVKAKRAIEYAVFAVIEAALRRIPSDHQFHRKLLQPIYSRNVEPTVLSLNYDVIVDNAMFYLSEQFQGMQPPDYRVQIATERYTDFCTGGTFGQLLKIHGSLNWLYCERCGRLDLFVSEGMRTGKALDELYNSVPFDDAYSCRGTPCRNRPNCDGFVSPVLITPTYVKDYENPHIERVWAEAEAAMKEADRATIIGYSLPTDDVEVAMLFKRGLDHLPRDSITVVEYIRDEEDKPAEKRTPIEEHPTGQRFRSLFGAGLDWHTTGFKGWLRDQKDAGRFPFTQD